MSRSKFVSMLATCLAIMFTASLARAAGFTFISKELLRSQLANPSITILDVRSADDWNASQWKIKKALRESPADVRQWMHNFSKDQRLVLYCA